MYTPLALEVICYFGFLVASGNAAGLVVMLLGFLSSAIAPGLQDHPHPELCHGRFPGRLSNIWPASLNHFGNQQRPSAESAGLCCVRQAFSGSKHI